MGLGTKIKEALSSDHHDNTTSSTSPTTSKHTTSTNTTHSTPGSFPSDDLPQRHADGKEYTAPHGTALSDAKWKETGANTGTHTGGTHTGGTHSGATTGTGLSSSGTQRNKLSKGGNEYDAPYDAESSPKIGHHTQDSSALNPPVGRTTADKDHSSNSPNSAYWGDLSQGGRGTGATTHGIPDRTHAGEGLTGSTGTHTGHHMPRDEAVGGGTYNANAGQHGHIGSSNRDPTENSHFGDEFSGSTGHHQTGTTGHRDHLLGSSGAGTHNSSSLSSGNPEQFGSRTAQPTGAGHSPLSSGNDYDQQNTGYRGDSLHTSQNDRTGHGHTLAGAGAAAGVGAAAGYGAHEYSQNKSGHGQTGSGGLGSDGVPRSSMLDPEPSLGNTSHTQTGVPHSAPGYGNSGSPAGAYTGVNDPEGTHGPHSSRIANAADPRIDSDRDHRGVGSGPLGGVTGQHTTGQQLPGAGSNINAGTHSSGNSFGSSSSPTQGGGSGSDRKHFGPGHEGAKVMHSCDHCGKDNDISHYFSKDVVYRLGQ